MRIFSRQITKRLLMVVLFGAIAGAVGACGFKDPLRVEDPGTLTDEELTGVGAIPATVNGLRGGFHEAFDDYARYACMFTDECILAGTFPSRVEVENRRILANNVSLSGEVYEDTHTARFQADDIVQAFSAIDRNDPQFETVLDVIDEGIVSGYLYGGYTRIMLSELYCESAIDAGPYLFSDARMGEALGILEQAEQEANAAGLVDFADAAIVGQARAHLWLAQDTEAAADAARVSAGFEFFTTYSENDNPSYNEVHSSSWGRGGWVIRWTVGDGTTAERNNERFGLTSSTQFGIDDSYDQWVSLGLIDPNPGPNFVAFNSTIPVRLQLLYPDGFAPILMASKAEADFIEAEVAIRGSDFTTANNIANAYRTAWGLPAIDYGALADLPATVPAGRHRPLHSRHGGSDLQPGVLAGAPAGAGHQRELGQLPRSFAGLHAVGPTGNTRVTTGRPHGRPALFRIATGGPQPIPHSRTITFHEMLRVFSRWGE
jgi:hypothetical protein